MKRTSYSFLFFCFLNVFSFAQNVDVIAAAREKITTYHEVLPTEKLYLQTDRTIYRPGETIWFKTYLTGANHQIKNTQSSQFLVELIDPKGKVTQQCNILRQEAREHGDFRLSSNVIGGIYKIRAYSEWMRNFGEDLYFEKELTVQKIIVPKILLKLEIEKESYGAGDEVVADLEVRALDNEVIANHRFEYQVQLDGKTVERNIAGTNDQGEAVISYRLPEELTSSSGLLNVIVDHEGKTESIARPIPIQFDNIALDFMPEGGDLVANLSSKVAFKSLNEFGKSADIEGVVLDEFGKTLTTFSSFHDGMGAFEFTPRKDQKYRVKITKPRGIGRLYELPKVYNEGVVASLSAQNEERIQFELQANEDQVLYAILQMQDSIFYTQKIEVEQGKAQLEIPTVDFPMGIAQVTFLDELARPQSERMVFLNAHRRLQVDIQTDKDRYQPREEVNVVIKVTDSAGKGVAGNFSVAVVDDKLYTYADDKQDNILSYFLMSSELRGKIHEPSFYFDPEEEKAAQALDYVLMTYAWRRFNWKDILAAEKEDWEAKVQFPLNQVMIRGNVRIGYDYIEGAGLRIEGTEHVTSSGKQGYFEFKNIARSPDDFTIIAKYKKRKKKIQVNPRYHLFIEGMIAKNKGSRVKLGDVSVRNDFFKKKKVDIEELKEVSSLPTRNLNDLAATSNGLASADEGGDISVRGSRSNMTEYYVDGIRVSGALIPESEANLDEVVVVGISSAGLSTQLSTVDLTLSGTPASSSGNNQDYDFNVSTPIYLPEINVNLQWANNGQFYYPRTFYAPVHNKKSIEQRSDFRTTVHWQPNLITDADGNANFSFYASDEISTFRTIVEGISDEGEVARGEATYYTQLPFSIDAKLPLVLVRGDEIEIPVVIKNNTNEDLDGRMFSSLPAGFEIIGDRQNNFLRVAPDGFKKLNLRLKVSAKKGKYPIRLTFNSGVDRDQISATIEVVPSTFPRAAYLASSEMDKMYQFGVSELLEGSLSAKFRAIPDVMEEMVAGVEGVLREPSGCFEQVSSSNYPNILVLQLMNARQEIDRKLKGRAENMLARGYKKLTNYEVRGGGFSLYGRSPASVRLTAYGLVQFNELRQVYDIVNQKMIDRAVDWLLDQRNEEGLFDNGYQGIYGGYERMANAYVVYALSNMKAEDIEKALAYQTESARQEKDLYCLALMALANQNYGKEKEAQELRNLIEEQINGQPISEWKAIATLTYSYGYSKQVELASWVALALLESETKNLPQLEAIMQFLYENKRGAGYFGSTQATALALKAMLKYSQAFSRPSESGELEIYVNQVLAASKNYDEATKGVIAFNDLGEYFAEGNNTVQVRFTNTSKALPYTFDINWQAHLPELEASSIVVNTQLEREEVRVGESVRLTAKISNLADRFAPTPMAIIGIPSSLSLDVKQLKLLQEKGYFDFFEIQDNYLVLHYESLAAKAVKEVPINLKVEFAGNFKAPVNSAFLYYQSEQKHWESGKTIAVVKNIE
ncbi:MAG: MG2 domain-containing protein [Bacteroidota bacterium]